MLCRFRSAVIRVTLLTAVAGAFVATHNRSTAATLPEGAAPPALEFQHFPDRLHAFVFRNWPVVSAERMAQVVGTSPENISALGKSLGLPPQPPILEEWTTRGYITVLRRNWHLLPYDQILTLLDVTAEELAFSLREDDFLFIKLGSLKPKCAPLVWSEAAPETQVRAAEIASLLKTHFPEWYEAAEEPRFSFIQELSQPLPQADPPTADASVETIRFIYSYFALFGDPLLNANLDPYPEGLLQRLSKVGVNGVWLHTVLRTLAPSDIFPEFGQNHETRLQTLRALVDRAARYGIKIYLYTNEPRSMPAAFFEKHPEAAGVAAGDHRAMCTSSPEVLTWLRDSLEYVFREVPGLGGAFTISASENLTSCASHFQHKTCPRCQSRSAGEIIAEVNTAVEQGVHRGNPDANVIVWDWGWPDGEAEAIIQALPKSVWLQSVSEWSTPIQRGGIDSVVGEYSISAPGPGPRASRHWQFAQSAGLRTMAKVQFNNTWELAAIPYLPVLDLVAEHAGNLAQADIDGMMLSWSLGGYPSPNLEVSAEFFRTPDAATDTVLQRIAERRYGTGADQARIAWSRFSEAMRQFPYHIAVLYNGPQNAGPMNILFPQATGYNATMVGFPYDALNAWRGPFPPEIFAQQFNRLAEAWMEGLSPLQAAVAAAPAERKADALAELRFAKAAAMHFKSAANQSRFIQLRDRLNTGTGLDNDALNQELKELLTSEIEVAKTLWSQARADSRIGYEASNHYFYLPIDLVEKVLNCQHLLEHYR